jgi:hypothetical protein
MKTAKTDIIDRLNLWWGRKPTFTLPEPEPIDVWLSRRGFAV